ncbi:MAG: hypothetical protein ACK57N_07245 [Planctomycetia bacterium]
MKKAGWLLGAASAALVVVLVLWDADRVSPGTITRVHAASAGLDDDDCESCHGDGPGGMASACGECHADTLADIRDGRGLHGGLADAASCQRCHGEHHGPDHPLVSDLSFALAGIADRSRYAHEGLAFALTGAHAGLACERCHPHADAVLLEKGQKRFDGLAQDCASCHADPHGGKLPDCASCHGQERPFAEVALFEHTAKFPLEGVHAGRGCQECHPKDSARAIESYATGADASAARGCVDCHAQPHAADFLGLADLSDRRAVDATCVECHGLSQGAFGSAAERLTPAQHERSGFALAKPHEQLECGQCHAADASTVLVAERPAPPRAILADGLASRSRLVDQALVLELHRASHPDRAMDDCASCHADPHAGQFADAPGGATNCLACHDRHAFEPHGYDLDDHARTAFPLEGAHARAKCESCHEREGAGPRAFRGVDQACSACHSDAHAGFFAARGDADCRSCHDTHDFAQVAGFDHGRSTGFVLDGRHAEASCEACHRPRATPDEHGRTFGRVEVHGDAQDCASCHADAHRGKLADARGATDCAACHDSSGFDRIDARFDHARDARHPLLGAHAALACATCHPTQPRDERGRAFGFAKPLDAGRPLSDCRACHADPHEGAFDAGGAPGTIEGRDGCQRCHTEDAWSPVRAGSFDHGAWTGFALDGAHAEAACTSCHARLAEPAADGRQYAKVPGVDCASCHADVHLGQFAQAGKTDCARCHSTAPGFEADRFDHATHSRFALDERHARLSCEACHRPASTVDGRVATRYKPLGTTCADCHGFGFEDEGGKGRGRGRGGDRDGRRDDDRRDDDGEREDGDQQQGGAARLRYHLLGELLERRSSEARDQPR